MQLGNIPRTNSGQYLFLESYPEFDDHEFVIEISDKKNGLRGFIAIHDSSLGITHGGTRMQAYKNEPDALRDVLNLSKAMSYKSALAGLPYGGAKGVIIFNDPNADRQKILEAYAKRVEALSGLFRTGTDVGLTDEDTRHMSTFCNYILGAKPHGKSKLSTSSAAALGVFYAIQTAAEFRYGTDDLSGKTIGIKGIGKLGHELARLLYNEGARLVIADKDDQKLADFKKEFPLAVTIGSDVIHKHSLNIYAPCALGNEFDINNVKELNCDIISGGANNQLSSLVAGDSIFRRGILYVPDYIANAGGLIYVSDELEKGGFKEARVLKRLENIKHTLKSVFERSRLENIPTHRVSDKIAQERILEGSK